MALLPYALRPSVIVRRKAIRQGVLGQSTLWKVVAAVVFGRKSAKKFFGKNPEKISTEKVGHDAFLNVINAKPMTSQQRTQAGITKADLRAQAAADVAAAWARKAERRPKRKVVRRAEKTAALAAAERERARKKARKRAS